MNNEGLYPSSAGLDQHGITDAGTGFHRDKTLTFSAVCNTKIATTSLPQAHVGIAYSVQLAVSGGKSAYTWSITSGTLPAGLSMNSSGLISGTPSTQANADPVVTFAVSDANGCTDSIALVLGVRNTSIDITNVTMPPAEINTPYSLTLTTTGASGAVTWSAQGLPVGFSINASTGVVTGQAAITSTNSVTITATDSTGAKAVKTFTFLVKTVAFFWRSGPQFNNVAFLDAGEAYPNPVPVGIYWIKQPSDYGGFLPSSGFQRGEPYVVYVDNVKTSNPTMSVTSSVGNFPWSATLLSYDAGNKRAKFALSANVIVDPSADVTLLAQINDGPGRSETTSLLIKYRALNYTYEPGVVSGGGVASQAVLKDGSGTLPPTSYSTGEGPSA